MKQIDKKELEQMWKDGKISFKNYRFFAEKMMKSKALRHSVRLREYSAGGRI